MTDDGVRPGEEAAEGVRKAFRPEEAGPPGPGRIPSDAEQLDSADTEPESPLGVGESVGRRAEEIAVREEEEGRETLGTKGPSERPYGESTAEQSTGVAAEEPIDDESPTLPTGDQGG